MGLKEKIAQRFLLAQRFTADNHILDSMEITCEPRVMDKRLKGDLASKDPQISGRARQFIERGGPDLASEEANLDRRISVPAYWGVSMSGDTYYTRIDTPSEVDEVYKQIKGSGVVPLWPPYSYAHKFVLHPYGDDKLPHISLREWPKNFFGAIQGAYGQTAWLQRALNYKVWMEALGSLNGQSWQVDQRLTGQRPGRKGAVYRFFFKSGLDTARIRVEVVFFNTRGIKNKVFVSAKIGGKEHKLELQNIDLKTLVSPQKMSGLLRDRFFVGLAKAPAGWAEELEEELFEGLHKRAMSEQKVQQLTRWYKNFIKKKILSIARTEAGNTPSTCADFHPKLGPWSGAAWVKFPKLGMDAYIRVGATGVGGKNGMWPLSIQLASIWVKPEMRSQGIFTAFIDAVEELADEWGVLIVHEHPQKRLQGFLSKRGYRDFGGNNYVKPKPGLYYVECGVWGEAKMSSSIAKRFLRLDIQE